MTRTRKLTVKEFSHLVSESLDIANVTSPQSLVDNSTVFSEISPKHHARFSSFQRIFSRPTPGQHEDSPEGTSEDLSGLPRKMITWPFSRSPRKNRPTENEDNATDAKDPSSYPSVSPYSVTSLDASSTSSLGSLIPAHERLFEVTSRSSDERPDLFTTAASSPGAVTPPHASGSPIRSGRRPTPLGEIFGNGSASSVLASSNRSTAEPTSGTSNQSRTSFETTEASHSVANSDLSNFDEDPTPRASTFGPRTAIPFAEVRDDPGLGQSRPQRLSLVVPSRNVDILALRPAVGVVPHAPSETEYSASVCSTSSRTSTVARSSTSAFPVMRPSGSGATSPRMHPSTPPNPCIPAAFPDVALPANPEIVPGFGFSPRQRTRAMSPRSLTPPPLPRPPPTGPLPAVPSSVPPVPPLPPLLHKISMNTTPHSALSSPPRSTIPGASMNPATALPPSSPGGLRLPSRLSWVNSVRAVLPSPPASPTKSHKSLSNSKLPPPASPSKAEKRRPNELKRPTSIGVIEAADNTQVRRTKSILLLGSKSKSNASLGTKRVQIHADVNLDASTSRKPRRKSSAVTVSHPISSDFGSMITPTASSELLVPRERRHSAPILSSTDSKAVITGVSADWTLSLPFCTDVPGNKILPSPSLTPQHKPELHLEQVDGEDWTLCMPLKVRVDAPTIGSTEGRDCGRTLAETSEVPEGQTATQVQLPTPSPSPTLSTPSSVLRPLDPDEDVPLPVNVDRPASPASLGPDAGGLDLAGGCGKRGSGWYVYGWFDEVSMGEVEAEAEDEEDVVASMTMAGSPISDSSRHVKSHVTAFRNMHDTCGRHPSQDSTSTVSTLETTTFYSARSSLLAN